MKRRIKKFISNSLAYNFPEEQSSLNWNFTNLSPKVTKFPGMSGGFDEYLGAPAPSDTGNITVGWKLISSTWAGLRPLKDDVRAMAASEVGRLITIPEDQIDESRGLRWAEARVNNISIPENAESGTHEQTVSAQFQAVDPTWYGCAPTADTSEPAYNRDGWLHFDDGHQFDSGLGLIWGGPRVVQAGIGDGSTVIATNRGNHLTLPRIRIIAGTIASYIGVRRRDARGVIREAFEWSGTKESSEVLDIDCKTTRVTLETIDGNTDAYAGFSVAAGPGFIELAPGANTLEIYGDVVGASVEIYFHDAWY